MYPSDSIAVAVSAFCFRCDSFACVCLWLQIALGSTCSCPMEGKPGEGPEAMDVTLICPAIWPMLLVAILVAMETLLRFIPLLLYMLLLLFCWVNCGDACCCENILWRGEEHNRSMNIHVQLNQTLEGWFSSLPVACCHVALWPTIHVRRTLKRSASLALLHHRRLCVGHAWRKQRALWCPRPSKASICLLVHTCHRCTKTVQRQRRCNFNLKCSIVGNVST